ncbi:hypothetical protein D917_01527 [Trichinella nativa]|uniref:Uncharacterized protein n=1 Tax=Trichinella nativa TaxID=6335 RepID=A0A1Y3EPC1_9BILA|nr:hypothetical protein D917_01527 [Trichinella nativa]
MNHRLKFGFKISVQKLRNKTVATIFLPYNSWLRDCTITLLQQD